MKSRYPTLRSGRYRNRLVNSSTPYILLYSMLNLVSESRLFGLILRLYCACKDPVFNLHKPRAHLYRPPLSFMKSRVDRIHLWTLYILLQIAHLSREFLPCTRSFHFHLGLWSNLRSWIWSLSIHHFNFNYRRKRTYTIDICNLYESLVSQSILFLT